MHPVPGSAALEGPDAEAAIATRPGLRPASGAVAATCRWGRRTHRDAVAHGAAASKRGRCAGCEGSPFAVAVAHGIGRRRSTRGTIRRTRPQCVLRAGGARAVNWTLHHRLVPRRATCPPLTSCFHAPPLVAACTPTVPTVARGSFFVSLTVATRRGSDRRMTSHHRACAPQLSHPLCADSTQLKRGAERSQEVDGGESGRTRAADAETQ
jgi:hypothetical protein